MDKRILTVVWCAAMSLSLTVKALPLDDFDRQTEEEQGKFVSVVLSKIFDRFNAAEQTRHKARCMADLFEAKNVGGNSKLMDLINLELGKARRSPGKNPKVENIIYGVVLYECGSG